MNSSGSEGLSLRPKQLLRRYGIRPKKSLGQHFLVDRGHLAKIVAAADLRSSDVALEIGPGLGVLTVALAESADRVVAVELDERMRAILLDVTRDHPNVEIVAADILDVDPASVAGIDRDSGAPAGVDRDSGTPARVVPRPEPLGNMAARSSSSADIEPKPGWRRRGYKVVANLPYYITSAVLRHVLEAEIKPERAVIMVQKEVADRILAEPGDMSVLAVAVQFFARPTRVSMVPAGAFYPPPRVDSSVLRLDVRPAPPVDVPEAAFFRVVRAGFSQKRKQLKNSLSAGLAADGVPIVAGLKAAGIDPTRRAQTLSLAEWGQLTAALGLELADLTVATLGDNGDTYD